ncbi:MAG: DUF255 domain-containing protein [Planctomycetaceae bacterium]|nr:DUF255 domain-containing protein [Planctomycetaceae bacterium]
MTVKTLFVLCFFASVSLAQEAAVHWETNFDAAVAKAQQTQRLLFVHIVGNSAASDASVDPSRQMDTEVFTNQEVVAGLAANYVPVRINIHEEPQLAKRFNVTALPTDLVLRPNGQLVHRRQGSITAVRFCQYLVFLKNTVQAASQAATQPTAQSPITQPEAGKEADTAVLRNNAMQNSVPVTAMQKNTPAAAQPAALYDPFTRQAAVPASVPQTAAHSVYEQNPARPVLEVKPSPPNAPRQSAPIQTQIAANHLSPIVPAIPAAQPVTSAADSDTGRHTVEVPLALEGFCPVTLSLEERWVTGNPAYCTLFQGALFRFSSQEALIAFGKEPLRFIPAAGGEDIVLVVDRNKHVNGSRKFGAWFQNRVFLFSSQETLDAFAARPEYYAEIAAKYEAVRQVSLTAPPR